MIILIIAVAVVALVAGAYIVYAPLTDLWCRRLDRKIVRRCESGAKVAALTFDDGPDPVHTPKVLDLLAERNIQAAFFVVGNKAKEYPEIIRRMAAEGHLIGTHTYSHHHAYMMMPVSSVKEVKDAIVAVRDSGQEPRWFRPPWGAFNLATRLAAASEGQRLALWSITGDDWKGTSAAEITSLVSQRLHSGAVVDLHDASATGGDPGETVKALAGIIEDAQRQGYAWERLDRMVLL